MLVGISGYAQAGKDSIGKLLVENHNFTRYAFADKLREFLYAQNPVVVVDFAFEHVERVQDIVDKYGWERAKLDYQEIRELLQRLGTEAGRKILGDNVWVEAVFNDINKGLDLGWNESVVITDVRFPNEAQAIKDHNGFVVRVKRPGITAANAHVSETSLDEWPFDYTIPNDATIEALALSVKHLVAEIQVEWDRPTRGLPGYGAPVLR